MTVKEEEVAEEPNQERKTLVFNNYHLRYKNKEGTP